MSGSRILRWRAAVTLAGGIFFVLYFFGTGRLGGYILQIDYTWGGGVLDGAQVVIDGEVVGRLESETKQRVAGFRVEEGEHVVRILHDDCEGVPETVQLGPSRFQLLMADLDDGVRCRVFLR